MRGERAEARALAYLVERGHVPVTRNFRVKGGEIDLVTRDGTVLVFTEVRHRSGTSHGAAHESVTPAKVARVRRTATRYLLRAHGTDAVACRFDVVAITGDPDTGELLYLENAF